MKNNLQRFWVYPICIFCFLMFCSVECNESSDETVINPCGEELDPVKIWKQISTPPPMAEAFYGGTSDGWAYYSFVLDDAIEDICCHQHIWVWFNVYIEKTYASDVRVSAEVLYGVLYTYNVNELTSEPTDPGRTYHIAIT